MCRVVLLALRRIWESARRGPQPVTLMHKHAHRQIRADSCVGELTSYLNFTKTMLFNLLHTLKPRHLKARRVLTAVDMALPPSEEKTARRCPLRCGPEAYREDRESVRYEWVNLTPGIWQSKEHSKPNTALQACTKGFSPSLKTSHWSFKSLKCWYCFPQDFRHAFNTKSPEVIIKERSNKSHKWHTI